MTPSPSPAPGDALRGSPFVVRDAVVDDAEEIEAVHWAARAAIYDGQVADWPPRGPDRPGRIERWRHWLGSPDITCILGEHEGRVAGFVTLRASKDDDATPGIAEMPTLYVDPASWRRGLGALLCRAAVERASSLGFHELTLWVLEINRGARAFYHAFGFQPDGTRKVDEGTIEQLVANRYRLRLPGHS